MKEMPVIQPQPDPQREREVRVYRVPMVLLRGCEEWAEKFHGQTFERIAERGGLSAQELVRLSANLTHHPAEMPDDDAHRILYALVVMYRRGQRSIVEGTDALPST